MASSRNSDVTRYRYGKCLNEKCDRSKDKRPLEIPSRKEFKCPDCGEPLYETAPPKVSKNFLPWIFGGIAVCALAFFIVWICVTPSGANVESLTFPDESVEMGVGETMQLQPTIMPQGIDVPVTWTTDNPEVATVNNGEVTAQNPGTAVITANADNVQGVCVVNVIAPVDIPPTGVEETEEVEEQPKEEKKETDKKPITPVNPNYGTVTLSYGTYTGDLKNGKPHGHGTVVYNTATRIVPSQDYMANPGNKVEADWRDGKIAGGIVYWYHDGDITSFKY